jgi:hypothetical protein
VFIQKELQQLQFTNGSMDDHVFKVTSLLQDLELIGARQSDQMQVLYLLYTLDARFDPMVQSINTEFVNQIISTICQIASIDSRLISSYHPRANGVTERFVQTISQTILKTLNGRLDNWETIVS